MQVLIDTSKKYASAVITAGLIAASGALWTVFVRPQLVMASDLQTVDQRVQMVDKKVEELSNSVNLLAEAQAEARVDYLQDRIRELEARRHGGTLTADEVYRLSEYKDRLEYAKAVKAKIQAGQQ